ncbi:hypothetical protein M2336_001675 [Sphingobium sp. B1D7B]|nr:hypothetical protein [Sphingobium sp. B1D7B]
MIRYARLARASGWVEDEDFSPEPSPSMSLTVSEHEAVDTGLLWSDGAPVMRLPNPIGFVWSE